MKIKYVPHRGHEWRERLPLGKTGYICVECNATIGSAKEMPSVSGTCRERLAPIEWLNETDRNAILQILEER